jgi:hypothetical protein
MVELRRSDAGRLLNLIGIGKALSGQGIATEETPPALLQIEPAGSFGNEDVLDTRMLRQPEAGLGTIVTAEIIGNHVEIALGIGRFDVGEQGDLPLGIA